MSPATDSAALAARGQADGSIAADLPLAWVVTLVWTSLFAGWLMIKTETLTRPEVSQLLAAPSPRASPGEDAPR